MKMVLPSDHDVDFMDTLTTDTLPVSQWRTIDHVANIFPETPGALRAKFKRYEKHGWIKQKNSKYAITKKGLAASKASNQSFNRKHNLHTS